MKIGLGLFLLVAWLTTSVFMTGAAFGSYYDGGAVGCAIFSGPLLTAGRHLLRSDNATKLTGRQIALDYATDMLFTAAFMSLLTHSFLGPYRDSPYLGIAFALVAAAIAIRILASKQPKTETETEGSDDAMDQPKDQVGHQLEPEAVDDGLPKPEVEDRSE